ncbi:pilus assembly protein PilP [Thiococcus pfennigii]|jgi:type IV pilus assembly protein PilP|uniref:pilus assembly protein PilP n=1 Tax=Thiococcus pfennigii TaxID=1057 RepID=UPI001907640E|nr:pilus assembly protein PilP [Thiococcus pfennigii]MBK1702562.1 pilus assembly protein PilP [Thiococcus pfennigii]MBK1732659.1 pilus assembly protein PilP [Thiococcus pfennigii]
MRPSRAIIPIAILLALQGCGSADIPELQGYVAKVMARPPGPIEPLPEIQPVETFAYEPHERRSPFDSGQRPEEEVARPASGLAPDPLRRKEELERHPLDALRMAGTLRQDEAFWALIQTKDGVLHRVGVGNYLGQNNGQITRITEDEIQLTEIVPDGMGDWRERQAAIALDQ